MIKQAYCERSAWEGGLQSGLQTVENTFVLVPIPRRTTVRLVAVGVFTLSLLSAQFGRDDRIDAQVLTTAIAIAVLALLVKQRPKTWGGFGAAVFAAVTAQVLGEVAALSRVFFGAAVQPFVDGFPLLAGLLTLFALVRSRLLVRPFQSVATTAALAVSVGSTVLALFWEMLRTRGVVETTTPGRVALLVSLGVLLIVGLTTATINAYGSGSTSLRAFLAGYTVMITGAMVDLWVRGDEWSVPNRVTLLLWTSGYLLFSFTGSTAVRAPRELIGLEAERRQLFRSIPIISTVPIALLLIAMSLQERALSTVAAVAISVMFGGTLVLVVSEARSNVVLARSLAAAQEETAKAEGDLRREQQYRAEHDLLTGLPNRSRLGLEVEELLLSDRPFALALLDIDDFKAVNDSLGHSVGDALLREVSRRLLTKLGHIGIVARLGGDEFVLLFPDTVSERDTERAAAEAVETLRYVTLRGRKLRTGASVGIAFRGEREVVGFEQLLARADQAMYAAKRTERGTVRRFDAQMQRETDERLMMETELDGAFARRELIAYFQPIVSMIDRRIVGAEALVRWQHPRLGLIGPARFLGLLEQLGLHRELETEMMRQAALLRKLAAPVFGPDFYVSVNFCPRRLDEVSLTDRVPDLLERFGMRPEHFVLEITETSILGRIDAVAEDFRTLRMTGVRVAIDDFGTGYSSLSYLAKLPIDILKLDRSFLADLDDPVQCRVIRGVVNLTSEMQLRLVAEGIEDEATVAVLEELGCGYAQGYLYGAPQPAAHFLVEFAPPLRISESVDGNVHLRVPSAQSTS